VKKEQRSEVTGLGPRQGGRGCAAYGPFSREDGLNMARLATDFHPRHLMGESLGEGEGLPAVLHPLWISGLVLTALGRIFAGNVPITLKVEHGSKPRVGDTLIVEARFGSSSDGSGSEEVRFVVTNQGRMIIAEGTAQLALEFSKDGLRDTR
jgi:hypothetical protein